MVTSGIYQIKNTINNKIYIGSAVNIKNRKQQHYSDLRLNKHHSIYLQNAYNKYGENNFEFIQLVNCPNKDKYDRKSAGGYRFMYKEQYELNNINN